MNRSYETKKLHFSSIWLEAIRNTEDILLLNPQQVKYPNFTASVGEKVKDEVYPRTGHEGTKGKYRQAPLFL